MIIQKQKSFEDILKALGGEKKIFIFGCADCATACKTGGEPELADMKKKLEEKGFEVAGTFVLDTACLAGEVRKRTTELADKVNAADSILVLACGTAVQTIGDTVEKICHAGCESLFIGSVQRLGKYAEKCSACGDCILEETDGICPVTRCAKGLMNGPCGGYRNGKCEVNKDQDCAWLLIYERLKARGKLGKLQDVRAAKSFATAGKARSFVWERK